MWVDILGIGIGSGNGNGNDSRIGRVALESGEENDSFLQPILDLQPPPPPPLTNNNNDTHVNLNLNSEKCKKKISPALKGGGAPRKQLLPANTNVNINDSAMDKVDNGGDFELETICKQNVS